MEEYKFTNTWFESTAKNTWYKVFPQIKPRKILEVGSYEGASACYMVEKMAKDVPIELHCVDTWEGGVEYQSGGAVESDMQSVEKRFIVFVKNCASLLMTRWHPTQEQSSCSLIPNSTHQCLEIPRK